MLVESNDGQVHRDRALPFIEAGLPVWIDKPFACHTKDAIAMVEAAQRKGVPILSASSRVSPPNAAPTRIAFSLSGRVSWSFVS